MGTGFCYAVDPADAERTPQSSRSTAAWRGEWQDQPSSVSRSGGDIRHTPRGTRVPVTVTSYGRKRRGRGEQGSL